MAGGQEIAIYLRLSAADGSEAESGSIANQRAFLHQWAQREGFCIVAEYSDDGHTGTDFERPGFQALMRRLERREIRCFATVDLSRLGRNYLEVGLLQEQKFPALGVRYIAVNDGYDSARACGGSIDPAVFKNLLNDLYAKDCSMKVLRAKRTLQRAGRYLGGLAPYGYRIDPADKYHLVPDEETAPVVRRIYEGCLAGQSCTRLAAQLTQEGVPTPAQSKRMTGRAWSGAWNAATVRRILTMPTYYGACTQHSTERVSYKVHASRRVPREGWIVVEGTHTPLVTQEEFRQAGQLLSARGYVSAQRAEHRLTGLVYCADCQSRMYAHRIGRYFYLTCYRYSRAPGKGLCTAHSFREDRLEALVAGELRRLGARAGLDLDALAREKLHKTAQNPARQAGQRLQARLEKVKNTRLSAYKDKAAGLLTEAEFCEIAARLRQEQATLEAQLARLAPAQQQDASLQTVRAQIEALLRFEQLNKAQLHRLCRRIEIGADRSVTIEWAFAAPEKEGQGTCNSQGFGVR